jgi:hypothetical protein
MVKRNAAHDTAGNSVPGCKLIVHYVLHEWEAEFKLSVNALDHKVQRRWAELPPNNRNQRHNFIASRGPWRSQGFDA